MDDKSKKIPEELVELSPEEMDQVAGGRLIDWTPVVLEPADP